MKKIYQYILLAVAMVATASCSNELDDTLLPVNNGNLQFVVSDFPAFGEGTQTRAIGTQDEGKTAWENGDQIIVTLTSQKYGEQAAALTYNGSSWSTEASLSYLENETPSVSVFYAPCYEVTEEGTMQLRSGMQLGMTEYLSGNYEIENGIMTITFEGAIRDYSRLRIVTMPEATLTVTTTDFTPAGATKVATAAYTLTTDNNGNAFLYGVFAEGATVSVKQGDVVLKDYTFSAEKNPNGTEHNKSYALDARPYLTFTSEQVQEFKVSTNNNYTLDESIQYSINGGAWRKLEAGIEIPFGSTIGSLRLRGKSSGGTASSTSSYASISFTYSLYKVACSGDIRTLVDYENYATVSTANARFFRLFKDCAGLTTAPDLPATDLADNCYNRMFQNCTSLTTAPELPATTLAPHCYHSMFQGCTSLATAPELPATTLAENCYCLMFFICTNLATAPNLPATTLADYCYSGMFQGCTSLATAPNLPATTLAAHCYDYMFDSCTNLITAPELPATTLAAYCYNYMFAGCTNLITAPELPATTLAAHCYNYMFQGCTSLATAPELPATTLAENCYQGMFQGCTSLATAPELPATVLTNHCYSVMFRDCTKLNSITMLATDILATSCLYSWVDGVASTGTFTKAASLEQGTESGQIPTGTYGIPEGWTVKNYVE